MKLKDLTIGFDEIKRDKLKRGDIVKVKLKKQDCVLLGEVTNVNHDTNPATKEYDSFDIDNNITIYFWTVENIFVATVRGK